MPHSNSKAPCNLMRGVRSFVLRQGRFSASQKSAMHDDLLIWGIPYQSQSIDLGSIFGRDGPKILDIGFGTGVATAETALNCPQNDYLCVEVHAPSVASLLRLIKKDSIKNIRLIHHDVVPILEHMLAPSVLDGVHIFFPDPWPKKRHHKRRLMQAHFVELLRDKLKKGGYFYCVTDWEDYATDILNMMSNCRYFTLIPKENLSYSRPVTKFEERALKLGHHIYECVFLKK